MLYAKFCYKQNVHLAIQNKEKCTSWCECNAKQNIVFFPVLSAAVDHPSSMMIIIIFIIRFFSRDWETPCIKKKWFCDAMNCKHFG